MNEMNREIDVGFGVFLCVAVICITLTSLRHCERGARSNIYIECYEKTKSVELCKAID